MGRGCRVGAHAAAIVPKALVVTAGFQPSNYASVGTTKHVKCVYKNYKVLPEYHRVPDSLVGSVQC